MTRIINLTRKTVGAIWQFLKDVKSTLYDTDGFMSLPRLILMASFLALVISVFAEVFAGFKHGDNTSLLGAMGIGIGGYSLKKFTDRSSGGGKE